MSSSFGTLFCVTTFGESHGQGVGAVIDGCPPKMPLDENDIQPQLDRRRPAQSELTTPREEADRVTILSGVDNGITLGTPIALMVKNTDQRPADYRRMRTVPRPSHADYTYQMKYGIQALSGGGRASARETVGRVAAGAVAEKFLSERYGIEIVAWVSAVAEIEAPSPDVLSVIRKDIDRSAVRCPDSPSAEKMHEAIIAAQKAGDSLGGIISCVCRNIPAGLGEPVFDKMEALLAQAMLSLPATKGIEIGSGFAGSRMRGSEHNDVFFKKGAQLGTKTNYSGGIQGGISNGEPIMFRVAFKPPATISLPQKTADFDGKDTVLQAKGRHDPCVVPRAVPIVESMAALVVVDLALRQKMRENGTIR
ncbi:MAG: chorismate synthase [Deltaproteobacteria bacterium]|jgi:chorismate synthase|nr:chorismate synthase [Deltaproteobacteria bacterium]